MLAGEAKLLDGSPLATPEALADLCAHALEAYPQECLGYIQPDGSYERLPNVSSRPEEAGAIDPKVVAALMALGKLRALCHSHPGGPDAPSETDMRSQIEMEVPFVIVATNGEVCARPFAWGDQLQDERDLVGRTFLHGVEDCYALIRAYYRQERGTELPDYPRNWEWWLDPTPGEKDLYRRYFTDAGFTEADKNEPQEGDVWLAAVRSNVPNHAGIYLPGGLALHHPSSGLAYDPMRLSKRDPIVRWSHYITHWLRRTV